MSSSLILEMQNGRAVCCLPTIALLAGIVAVDNSAISEILLTSFGTLGIAGL
jgi:hypothetical protein